MKLRLPHAVGYLVAGVKIAAPLALIGAVVGEFVGANRGIGFVILDAVARLATVEMLAGIVYVGLTGTVLFRAVEALELRPRALACGTAMRGSLAALGIVAWELAVRLLAVPDYLLPPPSGVAAELVARFALVARHGGVTLGEVGVGLAAAVGGGAVLAVAMASMPFLHRGLYPLLAFLQELGVEPIIVVEAKCPLVEVNRSSMLRCGNRRYDPWIDIRGSGLQA
jgi:ABC-type nitrate/sulfonate/bicarbonate transport system permease component